MIIEVYMHITNTVQLALGSLRNDCEIDSDIYRSFETGIHTHTDYSFTL